MKHDNLSEVLKLARIIVKIIFKESKLIRKYILYLLDESSKRYVYSKKLKTVNIRGLTQKKTEKTITSNNEYNEKLTLKNNKINKSQVNIVENGDNEINLKTSAKEQFKTDFVTRKTDKNCTSKAKNKKSNIIVEEAEDREESDGELPENDEIYNHLPILEKIFLNYIQIVNFTFDISYLTPDEIKMLSWIIKFDEIKILLQNIELDISTRMEILRYYRMVYIDVNVDRKQIDRYISLFVNEIDLPDEMQKIEDGYMFKFRKDLINVSNKSNLEFEYLLLKNELKYFTEIIKAKNSQKLSLINYVENGIVIPTYTFLNKLLSIVYNLCGVEYLRMYEITFYFLQMK